LITLAKYQTITEKLSNIDILFDFFRSHPSQYWCICDIERIMTEHGHNGSSIGRTLRKISNQKYSPIVRISYGIYGWKK
jgi:hypothetical protein